MSIVHGFCPAAGPKTGTACVRPQRFLILRQHHFERGLGASENAALRHRDQVGRFPAEHALRELGEITDFRGDCLCGIAEEAIQEAGHARS